MKVFLPAIAVAIAFSFTNAPHSVAFDDPAATTLAHKCPAGTVHSRKGHRCFRVPRGS